MLGHCKGEGICLGISPMSATRGNSKILSLQYSEMGSAIFKTVALIRRAVLFLRIASATSSRSCI